MSQLTLTLDDNLLVAAQAFAQRSGKQLDALVAEWLQTVVQPTQVPAPASLLPLVHELYGSLNAPESLDYKAAWAEALDEKYGL